MPAVAVHHDSCSALPPPPPSPATSGVWQPSPHDQKRLEEPLDLHKYNWHWRQNLGVSPLHYPSSVRGVMHNPKIVEKMERMAHHREARDRYWKSTWFDNGFIKIREHRMYIRELALCSMDVIKMILAYFPELHVCACSQYFEEPLASSLSVQIELLVHGCAPRHLTLVCKHPGGSRSVAQCLPAPPHGIRWEPLDEARVTALAL